MPKYSPGDQSAELLPDGVTVASVVKLGGSDTFQNWAGNGTTNAPASGVIGFDQSGIAAANMYYFDSASQTWKAVAGQTLAGYFGV